MGRLPCGGPRGLLPKWEGGPLKESKDGREGRGPGGRAVGSIWCSVRDYRGPRTCPSPDWWWLISIPAPHPSDCPPGCFGGALAGRTQSAAVHSAPAPRRQRRRPPGPCPPAGGSLSVARREQEVSDPARGQSLLLGTCSLAAGCWGPGARRPDWPGEDEERGKGAAG